MKGNDFYRITGPIEWAVAPKYFSYSSLTAIERCPLQWQLANSSYSSELGSFPARPTPAAVEGHVVHSILDKLFRALSLIGLPEFGTPVFRECVGSIDIKKTVGILVSKHEEKLAQHPRGSGFRLRSTNQQLTNQVIRLFKNIYSLVATGNSIPFGLNRTVINAEKYGEDNRNPAKLIDKYKALTEFHLENDELSFVGIIDLVWEDEGQTIIVDFKTGQKDENHTKQVSYYAVLWEKATGKIPSRVEVRYPGGTESLVLSASLLTEIEGELSKRISTAANFLSKYPAKINCGDHCNFCDVRQFCNTYWQDKNLAQIDKNTEKAVIDIELTITGEPTDYGFEAETNKKETVAVVYGSSVRKILGPFNKEDRCRILRASYKKDPLSIELKPWTEVFSGYREK